MNEKQKQKVIEKQRKHLKKSLYYFLMGNNQQKYRQSLKSQKKNSEKRIPSTIFNISGVQ